MNKKNIIALIYDFDGTLSPQPMQEYTVFPRLRINPRKFWKEVKKENEDIKGEEIITYMMKMLKKANENDLRISKSDLGKMALKIRYYPGVISFFKSINEFVYKESKGKVKVRHYLISSGLKEILEKTRIKKHFHNIFASEFHYDIYKKPAYPKLVMTDTVKTQFLFRINKGREKLNENINEFMAEEERPIPFSNIIYIGDGLTDVPCMTVTTKNGGYSIAVFNPKKRKSGQTCKTLFRNARVDFIAEANYCKGRELDVFVKTILKTIIAGIIHYNTQREMVRKRNIYR
jgi:hypothetical protein